jgi:predicted phage baseplate assembly protein
MVTFTPALPRPLHTRTAVLYGNVAKSTHGETISSEALGNGDAAQRFLAFPLKKSPVTFVPQPGAPNGVASTLQVRVDGILWKEVASLLGAGPNDRVYTTVIDDQAKTSVRFGGAPGGRVPTGRNNIIAAYRQGLGIEGNVRARSLTTLLDRPTGLKAVINPGAAEGGAMPEALEQARINAPSTVKTFGRIVSLRDFEDAARELVVVAKARAYMDWDGDEEAVFIIVAGASGSVLSASLREIAADLDRRRDINRKMRVKPHRPLPLEIALDVLAHPAYTTETIASRVKEVLTTFFAFDNRELGQPVFESDVYHLVQSQEGVLAVDLDRLRVKGAAGVPEMADIAVPLEAIASLDWMDVKLAVRHGEL